MPILFKDVQITESRMIGFICNKCKRQFGLNNYVQMQEMLYWRNRVGFGSIWGEDGTVVELSLCQKCAKELLGEYIIEV